MKKILSLLLLIPFLWQCKNDIIEEEVKQDNKIQHVIGLLTPIQLENDEIKINLEDYFMDISKIDSVAVPPFLKSNLANDKSYLKLKPVSKRMPMLSTMSVFVDGNTFDFLIKGPQKQLRTIALPDRGYRKVQIKGEMNSWNPNNANLKKKGTNWVYTFNLNPGDYQYIFMVDGKEMRDPKAPEISNGSGGVNSLLSIPKAKTEKLALMSTKSASGRKIQLEYTNKPSAVYAFWNNQKIQAKISESGVELKVPARATASKRSVIRAWGYNAEGLSNDIYIPLENGRPIQKTRALDRHDYHAQIMYFTLIDRFNNGNPDNDDPVRDDSVLPQANYLGGDIAGITAKIKDGYFKKLNINSIWLSPITQNPLEAYKEFPKPNRWYTGYHGYWPIFSDRVDHRFGDDAALKELVDAAHANDMNILLDFICNHVHEKHEIIKKNPDWATRLNLPNGQKNIRIWDEQRLTTWFDTFLPSLDFSKQEVIDLQSDSAMYWIKKFNLDGFRHDATKHVDLAFWRTLTKKLKKEVMVEENRSLFQIGETYGSNELIQSYINTGMLDAQFDFNLYFNIREVFAKPETSFSKAANALKETFNYFGHHSTMGYITGNHDIARFISLAGGALKFDENDREAGFSREIGVGDLVGYDRLSMMTAFLMTIPGVPVIFYGDEIGIPGAGDPDNRRMMRFSKLSPEESRTKKNAERLTKLRKNRMSLIYGDTNFLHEEDMSFAFARTYFDEITIPVFNKSDQEVTIELNLPKSHIDEKLKASFAAKVEQDEDVLKITMAPNSFDVLIN